MSSSLVGVGTSKRAGPTRRSPNSAASSARWAIRSRTARAPSVTPLNPARPPRSSRCWGRRDRLGRMGSTIQGILAPTSFWAASLAAAPDAAPMRTTLPPPPRGGACPPRSPSSAPSWCGCPSPPPPCSSPAGWWGWGCAGGCTRKLRPNAGPAGAAGRLSPTQNRARLAPDAVRVAYGG